MTQKLMKVVYDERREDYMYPHPSERDLDFQVRMDKLQKQLDKIMTPQEKRTAELLAKETLTKQEQAELDVLLMT